MLKSRDRSRDLFMMVSVLVSKLVDPVSKVLVSRLGLKKAWNQTDIAATTTQTAGCVYQTVVTQCWVYKCSFSTDV